MKRGVITIFFCYLWFRGTKEKLVARQGKFILVFDFDFGVDFEKIFQYTQGVLKVLESTVHLVV